MREETSIGGGDVRFRTTLWAVIRDAQSGSRDALERLSLQYWKPVYFFVRRRGNDVETSKDLTQAYFASLLERDFLSRVSCDRGRFRSFILASLANFLSDDFDRSRSLKRGGALDFVRAEESLPSTDPTPEKAFLQGWAKEVVERAIERLRGIVGREEAGLLTGDGPAGLSVEQKKQRARKVRQKLRECLMDELRPTVENDRQAEAEIRELLAALGP